MKIEIQIRELDESGQALQYAVLHGRGAYRLWSESGPDGTINYLVAVKADSPGVHLDKLVAKLKEFVKT